MYDIRLTGKARKDTALIERAGLKSKIAVIVETVRINPFEPSQDFKKLTRDLKGSFSRRINKQHRFVYQVMPNTEGLKDSNGAPYSGIVKIISMWGHYE